MAESSGRAGKSGGSGAGKGAVSAEQVRSGEPEGGQQGRVQNRCEERGEPVAGAGLTPVSPLRGRPERGGSLEKLAEPRGGEQDSW